MELKEVVLIYNIDDRNRYLLYENFFSSHQVELKEVTEAESSVPLGFLAYGSEEQKADYNIPGVLPAEPMMVFAGFTNQRLRLMLDGLKSKGLTEASLKAVLTEHNAVWDSATLYEQLAEERAQFTRNSNNLQEPPSRS